MIDNGMDCEAEAPTGGALGLGARFQVAKRGRALRTGVHGMVFCVTLAGSACTDKGSLADKGEGGMGGSGGAAAGSGAGGSSAAGAGAAGGSVTGGSGGATGGSGGATGGSGGATGGSGGGCEPGLWGTSLWDDGCWQ